MKKLEISQMEGLQGGLTDKAACLLSIGGMGIAYVGLNVTTMGAAALFGTGYVIGSILAVDSCRKWLT